MSGQYQTFQSHLHCMGAIAPQIVQVCRTQPIFTPPGPLSLLSASKEPARPLLQRKSIPPLSPVTTHQNNPSSPWENAPSTFTTQFFTTHLTSPFQTRPKAVPFMTKKKLFLKCVSEQKNKFPPEVYSVTLLEWKKNTKTKNVHLYLVPDLTVNSPSLHLPGSGDCVFRAPDSNSSAVTRCVIWDKSSYFSGSQFLQIKTWRELNDLKNFIQN